MTLCEGMSALVRSETCAPTPAQFLEAGFAVVPSVVDAELLERIAELAPRIVEARSDAGYEDRHRSIGSPFGVLSDTAPANGCLRVIPGSHRRRHALHGALSGSYTPDLRRMRDPQDAAFQIDPEEVCVGVRAGALVVLDARLLHAAHASTAHQARTAVSLGYLADLADTPECVLARFDRQSGLDGRLPYVPEGWPREATERLCAVLLPLYRGSLAALPMENRPGRELCA